jgi:membrane-associated protein
MSGVLDQLGELPDATMAVAIGLVMMLDAVPLLGIVIPADVALLTVVGTRGPAGAALAVAGVVAGTLAAWSLSYFIGRRVGERVRRGRLGRWVGAHRWDAAERVVRGGGARMLAVVPFLPVVNTVVPMVAGALGVPYRRFLRYAAVGTTVWATVYAVIGLTARTASTALLGSGSPLGLVLFGVPGLAISWVIVLVVRRQLAPPAQAGSASNGDQLLLLDGAGGEGIQARRLGRVAADGEGDPLQGRRALVGQRAEDRVLDEVGAALADRAGQPGVGLVDLGAELGQVPVDLGLRLRRDRRQLARHVRADDRPGSGVRAAVAGGRTRARVRRGRRGRRRG